MNVKLTRTEMMLAASLCFTMVLLIFRIAYTGTLSYIFYAWNLFLATIPYILTRNLLRQSQLRLKALVLICFWILFLPNAPYILTDLIHFRERPPIAKWFDLVLVISATWNGLILGMFSLLKVEQFLKKHLTNSMVSISMFASLLLCGFGIYVGRFLRFNSWDIIADPTDLLYSCLIRIVLPHQHMMTWAFSLSFAVMLSLIYFTFKGIISDQNQTPLNTVIKPNP